MASHGARTQTSTGATVLGLESRTSMLALFMSVNLLYFLVFVLGKSIVSLCCYLLMAPLMLGVFLKVLNLVPAEEGPWEIMSRSRVASMVDNLYEKANEILEFARDVCLWKDSLFTAKVCCVLLAVGYVSSSFSLVSLVFLVTWGTFVYTFCASILQETICPLVSPYMTMAKQAFHSFLQSIPKMEDSKKKV